MTTRAPTSSPPVKRIKLEAVEQRLDEKQDVSNVEDEEYDLDEEHCSICLQPVADRTIIPPCSHEFCFECLLVWTAQSRRCPLCSQNVGDYLIHHVRSKYDFQKHYLPPLRSSPQPLRQSFVPRSNGAARRRPRREVEWGRHGWRAQDREAAAIDDLERAIDKRRWIYRNRIFAKHVASNSFTRYRPFPTPAQFSSNTDLITRATIFVRRELRVWGCLDVEFLTTFTISLMKSLDIRSEPAVKLLAEFLDMDAEHELQISGSSTNPRANAEHFAHELYCYLRSPYRDLSTYDSVVQYDIPDSLPPPNWRERSRRWGSVSRSRSHSRAPCSYSRSRSRSQSVHRSWHSENDFASSELTSGLHSPQHPRLHAPEDPINDRRSSPRVSHAGQADDAAAVHSRIKPDGSEDSYRGRDDTRTDHSLPRDVKGKARAMTDSHLREEPQSQAHDNAQDAATKDPGHPHSAPVDDRPASHSNSPLTPIRHDIPSPRPAERRRPRVPRDAWTSVQAHLSNPGGSRGVTAPRAKGSETKGAVELSVKGAARNRVSAFRSEASSYISDTGLPSLLQRLSDPINKLPSGFNRPRGMDGNAVTAHDTTVLTFSSGTHTPENSRSLQSSSGGITSPSNTVSKPRVAMETVGNLSQSSRTIDESLYSSFGPLTAGASTPLSLNTSSLINDTLPGASDLRARLFNKLEDEKRLQQQGTGAISDSSTHDSPILFVARKVINGSPTDVRRPSASARGLHAEGSNEAEVEESLRRQAQLRARLAAEKRLVAGRPEGSAHVESSREAKLRQRTR